ncbi:MAG: FAD-dependent oxidoreductase, partial [Flavihumibacter sp.]|nr:FAD-dependent oxidoreductase [Flavihumibacter sp.]
MQTQVLIAGQGIAGTWLSYWLQQEGIDYLVIDAFNTSASSQKAAGIINPVTGRRIVTTWMINELLPFAANAYAGIQQQLNIHCFYPTTVLDFFATPQMRLAFEERIKQDSSYLQLPNHSTEYDHLIHPLFGYGAISPAYWVDTHTLLTAWRQQLKKGQRLLETTLTTEELKITENHIQYNGITAQQIIFCDGVAGVNNPWFKNLPYAPNKGEALLVHIPGLPRTAIYKRGINIVPFDKDLFWVGSSYNWEFADAAPTQNFYNKTILQLQNFIKLPFTVADHFAAIRPANLERRPFVGFHPAQKNIGLLNGLGTKGCSLAPYFGHQLVQHISKGTPILPEAAVTRFQKV